MADTHGGSRVSVCALHVEDRRFGVDTRHVREVLAGVAPQRVPLAPRAISGLILYRGEVLIVVSLRAVLGLGEAPGPGSVLVMEDESAKEQFGLAVDSVQDVLVLDGGSLEPNPTTLDMRSSKLFGGAYPTPNGMLVRLDTMMLSPSRIANEDEGERGVS